MPRKDVQALTLARETLFTNDTMRLQMGRNAIRHMRANFTKEEMVKKVTAVYDSLFA